MKRPLAAVAAALAMTGAVLASDSEPAPKRVALVFDDGPVPEQAPKLLALFESEGIRVTFAHVAANTLAHPETARATQAAGHEIVNHSRDHRHAKDLSDDELHHEISGAQTALAEVLGSEPRWYWPPFLAVDDRVRAAVAEAGLTLFPTPGLVSSDDWNQTVDGDQIRLRATTGVTDATVILFHEWRQETYEQLPEIIAELRRQGCVFLTFSELAAYAEKRGPASP